ncbi:NADH oxidoreductase HCR-like [Teleopsis dalmanni]|uniref:NADH oxidoreductase HCR-like n=1 Tax=Teleopsis dalmanni TaxID=139649 RepID=UPI0018CDFAF3|nr:NADH oxidoreductase HCR-like [Teleopsis dalmanni]
MIDGKKHTRAYSINSLPNDLYIKFTIKRVTDGLVSNWLIDSLQLGDNIQLDSIAGEFNIIDHPYKSSIVLFSAGCGAPPVMAMAKYLLQQMDQHNLPPVKIEYIHCAYDEENIIYHQELIKLAQHNPLFNYHISLKQLSPALSVSNYSTGRVNADFLRQNYPNLHESTIFLCGSTRFMQEIKQALTELNFDLSQFYYENFTPVEQAPQNQDINATVTITVPDFGIEQTAHIDDNLLSALESAQLPIIGACRAGVCGACRCKVIKGEVESSLMLGLSQEDIDQGYRLACVSSIKSDIEVSLS